MKKFKKSSEETRDRLSDLPDSVIFEIFGLLPMLNVVRTTILSKRWKDLWTTTPYLDFDGPHDVGFIIRALMLWKGFRIQKFKVGGIPPAASHPVFNFKNKSSSSKRAVAIDPSMFRDIDVWMRLCREKGIEEFYFEDRFLGQDEPLFDRTYEFMYCVPASLYSCSLLRVLSLKTCRLTDAHGSVQWTQLKSLTIEDCFVDQNLFNKVMSGCPKLEVLILSLLNPGDYSLSIRSTSLKRLSIEKIVTYDDGPSTVTELRIWAPNLETLHFGGVAAYDKYSLMNVSSVTDLTLDFSSQILDISGSGEILWQILKTFQRVEKVKLSIWCIKLLLQSMKDKDSISQSFNLKFLTINKDCAGDYERIIDLLQIFPKLNTLVLQSVGVLFHHGSTSFHYERDLPESFLLQLRTVEIALTEVDDLVFPFIEILLKHASKLQKMVFRVEEIEPPWAPFLLAQKLLRMPRSSPTAELIFAEY